ncbi:MAG: GldG family protein [Peptococcaceae bacterium]|nr:GldG family protein [Peptococcaceae bacterium]
MKRLLSQMLKQATNNNYQAFRGGTYSLASIAIVLVILIMVNIIVSALPSNLTQYDMSASKLYSITSNTKSVVNALDQDVTIYWIVQSGEEDDIIEALLDKYDSLSDHINVVKRNPDVYPTFAEQYTDETVQNNSLVVESGDRSKYISYDDIYVTSTNMYSYSYTTSFDGEGAITSAIDYVVTDDLPQMYILEGHGEQELPETFSDQIGKENIETTSFSLLTSDSVPEEADCVLIYEPQSDISTDEKEKLITYTQNGGKLLVISGPVESGSLENLNSLLADYGVTMAEGVVIEGDSDHYTGQPYVLLPDMNSNDMTDSLIEEHYYPNMPIAQGLVVDEETANGRVSELLTTSDESFSKISGYDLTTYEKEDDDIDGPFALAVSISCDNDGQIVWFSSATFLEDMYNALSSGANVDLTMNAISSLLGERDTMAIRSKSLNYNYLSITESTASLLKIVMIGIVPIAYLGIGAGIILKRRKRQHEAG